MLASGGHQGAWYVIRTGISFYLTVCVCVCVCACVRACVCGDEASVHINPYWFGTQSVCTVSKFCGCM